MNPSTTARASSSSEPMRASSSGSRNRTAVVDMILSKQISSYLKSALRLGYGFNQPLYHLIGINLFSLGLEVQKHTMPQHRGRNGTHVFTRNVVTPTQDRACFPAEDQKLRCAKRRAPRH